MINSKNIHKAFTLIEMLIVMTVFIILFGMTIAAFTGLRSSILMNQTSENIKQNFRWAQRAAILLKREPGENWIYGIGIDLSEFYREEGEYKLFKWCSPEKEFSQDPLAQGQFPYFNENVNLGIGGNGSIPFHDSYLPKDYSVHMVGPRYVERCDQTTMDSLGAGASALVEIKSRGAGFVDNFSVPKPLLMGYRATNPRFIVFESVSGTVFFYDGNGNLMNYQDVGTGYSFISDPTDVDFVITPPDKSRGINLVVNARSGKLFTNSANKDSVTGYAFEWLFVEPIRPENNSPATGDTPTTPSDPPDFDEEGQISDGDPRLEPIPGVDPDDRTPLDPPPDDPRNPPGDTPDPFFPPEEAM